MLVIDGAILKQFNIFSVLPIAQKTNHTDPKYDMKNIQAYLLTNDQLEYPVELLKPSDQRTRTKLCNDAIKMDYRTKRKRGF